MKMASILGNIHEFFLSRKINNLIEKFYASILFPEEIDRDLDELIGFETEKETLKDVLIFFKSMKFYEENPNLCPNRHFFLATNPNAGDKVLLSGLAKTAGVPIITFQATMFVGLEARALMKCIDMIFDVADAFESGCIIDFTEFFATSTIEENLAGLFFNHFAQRIKESQNTAVFLSTMEDKISIPAVMLKDALFNTQRIITMVAPSLDVREKLIAHYFELYNLPENAELIKRVARNTLGMFPKELEYVVRESMLYAERHELSEVTFKEFNNVLLTIQAGEKCYKLSEKERISTAYHEAGHVVAAYYSDPDYILGRVEITPRSESLGLTMQEFGEDKFSSFEHEIKNIIIYSYGGMAAEKLIYGETTSGTSADIANATMCADLMFSKYGMHPQIGPVFINAGSLNSDLLNNEVDKACQIFLKEMFEKTYQIVAAHKKQLEALTKALLEREVLIGDEIKTVLDNA